MVEEQTLLKFNYIDPSQITAMREKILHVARVMGPGGVTAHEVAQFWQIPHPQVVAPRLTELKDDGILWLSRRNCLCKECNDTKSRKCYVLVEFA